MNNASALLVIFITAFVSFNLFSQNECKVMVPDLVGHYEGRCKKGLAQGKGKATGIDAYEGTFNDGYPDGKGTYTWANHDVYTGQWKMGKRDGEGSFKTKINSVDTLLVGLWENDQYLGPKPPAPKIISMVNVDRYTFRKSGGIKDRVLIDCLQNGTRNTSITNYMMTSSSGFETKLGQQLGYDYVEFPVRIKVTYDSWNKMHSAQYHVIFEFEISEPGDWVVEINN